LLIGGDPRHNEGDDIEARWRREYPNAAAELERIAQKVIAKGTFFCRPIHGETIATNKLTVATLGDKKLFIRDQQMIVVPPPTKPYPTEVLCRTPDYSFCLTKRSRGQPYVIEDYSKGSGDDHGLEFELDYHMYARCATVYRHRALLERMQDPSFSVKAAAIVQEDGSDVVRIDYTEDEEKFSESGAVYLDPKLNWAIRRVDIVTQGKEPQRGNKAPQPSPFTSHVEYQKVGDNVYFPKRMESFTRTSRPGIYQNNRLELSAIIVGDVPEGIFKLTAYGLPDIPLQPVREPSLFSLHNPLFWGALITMVVSFVVLRLTRARASKTPASPAP